MIRIRFVDPDAKKRRAENASGTTAPEHAFLDAKVEHVSEEPSRVPQHEEGARTGHPDAHQPDGGLTLDWLSAFQWRHNPFTGFSASPARDFLVDRAEPRTACNVLILRQGRFGIIQGGQGSGKSFLLQWLGEELEGHASAFRVVRASGAVTEQELTKQLVAPYKGVLSRYRGKTQADLAAYLLKREERRLALLIDDADGIASIEPVLRALLANGRTTVVLAGRHPPLLHDANVSITLGQLKPSDAVELVRKRIAAVGGRELAPFSHDQLIELWHSAREDIGVFLELCEHAAVAVAVRPAHSEIEAAVRAHAQDIREDSKREDGKHGSADASSAPSSRRHDFDALIEDLIEPGSDGSTPSEPKKKK